MRGKALLVAEESANSFAICEDISEYCVRIPFLEKFMEGFSNGLAEKAIVW